MAPIKSITKKGSGKSTSSQKAAKAAPTPIRARKASLKNSRLSKQIFRGKIMSLAGNFLDIKEEPLPHEKIARWITQHGGIFEREVSKETTHLICTIEEYKNKSVQVQKAWANGMRNRHIVVLDWIEDCLLGKGLKKRLLAEIGYSLDRTIQRLKKGKTDHAQFRAKFEEGIRISKELCDNKLHHIYCDAKGFEYKVMISRVNLNGRDMIERYTIFLFESNAIPHTYMCGAKFTRTKRATSYYRDHCHPKDYTAAFADFKYIFKKKTGIEWDMRLERIKTDETFFVYTPPVLGRPVGDLPDGYIRPEERDPVVEYSQNEMEEDMEKSVAYDTNSEVDDSDAEDKSSSTQERSSSDTLFSGSSSSSSQNASPCKGIPFRSSSHSSHSSSSGAVSPRRPLPPCRATSISSDEGDESQ